MLNFNT